MVSGQSSDVSNQKTVDGGQRSERGIRFAGKKPVSYHPPTSTIAAILEPDVDGTLHLPIPAEMRSAKVKVTATLESVGSRPSQSEAIDALRTLSRLGTFGDIEDPVAWQRETRDDRQGAFRAPISARRVRGRAESRGWRPDEPGWIRPCRRPLCARRG